MDEINVTETDEVTMSEGPVYFPSTFEPAVRLELELYFTSLPEPAV